MGGCKIPTPCGAVSENDNPNTEHCPPKLTGSLWLLPPADSPLEKSLDTLINRTLPSLLPHLTLPRFRPHITVTSDVCPALEPYTVTGAIPLEKLQPPNVIFKEVNVGHTFFTRVTLLLEKTEMVRKLAEECRRLFVTGGNEGDPEARLWAREQYVPHLSLVYAEEAPDEMTLLKIDEEVRKAGVVFGEEAWRGGRIVLVNCSKPIEEWKIEGERTIPA